MSSCWFTVDVEPDVHLACFRLAGTFAAEDVERLIAERDRAFGSLTSAQNRHVALVDIRKMTPQGLSGFAAFGQLLLRQEPRALRLAFLIVTNLASMQAQLAAHGRGAQFFFDEAQARTWLLAHDTAPLAFPLLNQATPEQQSRTGLQRSGEIQIVAADSEKGLCL